MKSSLILNAARQQASLSMAQLWVAYVAVGGTVTPTAMGSFLSGAVEPDENDHDLIAQAINELFTVRGMDHPVPYFGEVT